MTRGVPVRQMIRRAVEGLDFVGLGLLLMAFAALVLAAVLTALCPGC